MAVLGGILGAVAGFVVGVVLHVAFWNNSGLADVLPFALAVVGIPLGAAAGRSLVDRRRSSA
jgi:formate-dependent nitrite reductase membrane component NrfD